MDGTNDFKNFVRDSFTGKSVQKCVTIDQFKRAAADSMDRVNASFTRFCNGLTKFKRTLKKHEKEYADLKNQSKERQRKRTVALEMFIARCQAEIDRREAVCATCRKQHQELAREYKGICERAAEAKTEEEKLEPMWEFTTFLIELEALILDDQGRSRRSDNNQQIEALKDKLQSAATKEEFAEIRDSLSGEYDKFHLSEHDLEMPRSVYDKIPDEWPEGKLPSAFNCYNTDNLFQKICPDAYESIKNQYKTCDLSDLHEILNCLTLKQATLFWSAGILVHHVIDTIMETSIRRTYATGANAKRGFTVDARGRMITEIKKILNNHKYCFAMRGGNVRYEQVAGTNDSTRLLWKLEDRKNKPIRKLDTPTGLAEMIKARRAKMKKKPKSTRKNIAGFTGFVAEPECVEDPEVCEPEKPRHVLLPCDRDGGRTNFPKHAQAYFAGPRSELE